MKKFILFTLLLSSLLNSYSQDYPVKYFNLTSQQQPLKMAYVYEKAAGGKGKTVVLFHGKNFSHTYWSSTIAALLKNGFNVLAPDQIGFGNSSMPDAYQYSFHQLASNTHLLMDSLGIKTPVILGHSIGGMLAVRYVLMYPAECSQLILEDPIGLEDWKLTVPYTTIDENYKTELKKTKETLKKYMLENYFHGEWKNIYDTLLEQSSVNLGNRAAAWNMALTSEMLFTQPVLYEFSQIKVPATLIIGDLDRTAPGKEKAPKAMAAKLGNYPELGKQTAAAIPGCRLVMLNGIGHIPHIENFDLFITTLLKALK
jgi:pimeloyl-ACP methyl ester carboxylesterase